MVLHRDIYWVGKQWAVTGYGIQTCDQKRKSQFDIEASRIWEDGVQEGIRALKWVNLEDFDKAISIARKHYPEPPRTAPPAQLKPWGLLETALNEARVKAEGQKAESSKDGSVESPPAQKFEMRIGSWPAKFVTQWRIRTWR